jgi:hypothetical protein
VVTGRSVAPRVEQVTAEAIGEVLPLALGVALSPVGPVAIIVLLGAPRGRATATAFAAGWLAGCIALGALCLILATQADATDGRDPSAWAAVAKLALGILLIGLAVRKRRGGRDHDDSFSDDAEAMPGWMRRLYGLTAARAFAVAAGATSLNPKNLGLTIGAAVTIAEAGLGTGADALAMAIFVSVAALGVIGPVLAHLLLGARAATGLDALKDWVLRHYSAILSVVLVVLGVTLVGEAFGQLL